MTLARKKPLQPGSKGLKRTPMKRGTVALVAKKPMARGSSQLARNTKPMRTRSKTNSNPRKGNGEAELCRGQPCYLLVPGVLVHRRETVVPCHSNQSIHGKGMGIKAHDEFTVPGCDDCHREIDQGNRFTREQKFEIWNQGFARWEPKRDQLLAEKNQNKV